MPCSSRNSANTSRAGRVRPSAIPSWHRHTSDSRPNLSLPPELLPPLHLRHHPLLRLHPATATHRLEHLPHLRVLPQQIIHVLHRSPRPARYPFPPTPIDDLVVVPLLRRHRINDRLHAVELPLIH